MIRILQQRVTWRPVTLIACETALIFGAVVAATYLRLGDDAWEMVGAENVLPKGILIASVCQMCLYYADLYNLPLVTDRRELIVRTLQALGASSLILAFVYFWFPFLVVGRGVFTLVAIMVVGGVLGWRVLFDWLTTRVGQRERLLLVGTQPASVTLARELYERKELGIQIVGFIDPDPLKIGQPVLNPGVVGTIEQIPDIVQELAVNRVVVSLDEARGRLPMEQLLNMRLKGVKFNHLASVYEEYTGKIAIENLRPSWLLFSSGFSKSPWLTGIKRSIDVVSAGVGLVLLAPVMPLIALAVKVSSAGPVFYHQKRVGQHGRVFTLHKFRSMRADAEANTGAVWAAAADDRVTVVGRILRATRLDEIPQLWQVLQGDMSLVGPRPERPEFVTELTKSIPFYGLRHEVKPGLTGWAQVKYRYGASAEDSMEKLQHDLFYIKNMSVPLDLFIIFKTVKTVVARRGVR
jgi:sugar transferase (PEP-CTERM system associated)